MGDMGNGDKGLSRAQVLQADRRLARPAEDRLRRPLPVPPLRSRRAAGRDDDRAVRDREGRQGALDRFLRVGARADRGGAGHAGRGEVRLQPAAIFPALSAAGEEGDPTLRGERRIADRLVAPGPGRADRQIRPGRAAAVRHPRDLRQDERLHQPPDVASDAGSGAGAKAGRPPRRASPSASSRLRGCCANPTSPRPSWGRAGPSSSTKTAPRQARRSIRRCFAKAEAIVAEAVAA